MRIAIKLIVTACFGLLYMGCKEEKKPTVQPPMEEEEAVEPSPERVSNLPKYDHFTTNGLEWGSFEEIVKNKPSGSKKYVIDIYTEWCQWCRIMDKKTFADEEVQSLLKENFHIAKYNAESRSDIQFKGVPYEWKNDGRKGINELAAELMEGQLSYPTVIFLDEEMNIIRLSRGYKNPQQFKQELEIVLRS